MECNKLSYESKTKAKKDAKIIFVHCRNSRKGRGAAKLYPYSCRHCGQWHLTSQKTFKKLRATEKARLRNT